MKGGQSLLHVAASKGDVGVVDRLVDAQVDINARDKVKKIGCIEIVLCTKTKCSF